MTENTQKTKEIPSKTKTKVQGNKQKKKKKEGQGKLGGFKRGISRSGLVLPLLSFLGLPPDFSGIFPICLVIFPICPLPLSRPLNRTYEEQSRKGPRHNLELSWRKMGTPRFGNPPGLASFRVFFSSGDACWRPTRNTPLQHSHAPFAGDRG